MASIDIIAASGVQHHLLSVAVVAFSQPLRAYHSTSSGLIDFGPAAVSMNLG